MKAVGLTGPANKGDAVFGDAFGAALEFDFYTTQDRNKLIRFAPFAGDSIDPANDGWVWVEGTFTVKEGAPAETFANYLNIRLANVTGGALYVAEARLQEMKPDGSLGPDVMQRPSVNVHQHYNQQAAFRCDKMLEAAGRNGVYLKVVLFEKEDDVWGSLRPEGGTGPVDQNHFYGGTPDRTAVNAQRRYQRAFLRYAAARYGWSPYVHSFEFCNEGDPFNGFHYAGANHFADYVHQINVRPMLAVTSFWHSQPVFWNDTGCDFIDVHRAFASDADMPGIGGLGAGASLVQSTDGRGGVLRIEGPGVTSNGTSAGLRPIPVDRGHVYRISFDVRTENLDRNGTNQFQGGPQLTLRAMDAHSNGTAVVTDFPSFEYQKDLNPKGPISMPWTRRTLPDLDLRNVNARYLLLTFSNDACTGTAFFDALQILNLTTGKTIKVTNEDFDARTPIKLDTAVFAPTAWTEYIGGGGTAARPLGMPWVWGEVAITGPQIYASPYKGFRYTGEDQRLVDDTNGIWFKKQVWGQIAPGSAILCWWWMDLIRGYNLYPYAKAYRAFLQDIPINNSRYVDAEAVATGGLRVVGQKDVLGRQAHLWIDNPSHNWKNVVDRLSIPSRTGTVRLSLPDGDYAAEWWDTRQGVATAQTVLACVNGVLELPVSALSSDVAVKVFPSAVPPPADTIPPTTSASVSGPAGKNGWYTRAAQVTLSASDAGSGVAATYYRINEGEIRTYDAPFTVSGDGKHAVSSWSVDKAGPANTETPQDTSISIDGSAPAVTAAANPATLPAGKSGAPVEVTISGRITEATSGTDTANYAVVDEYGTVQPSGPVTVSATGDYSFKVRLEPKRKTTDKDGRLYTITVRAADKAGNAGSAPTTVKVL